MKKVFLSLNFVLLMLVSCSKDTVDYRTNYTGNFTFTVIKESWNISMPVNQYDTTTYNGTIKIYAIDDNLKDLSSFDSIKNPNQRFTIEFLQNTFITPEINESGSIANVAGYHYAHGGSFNDLDSISFFVEGLGGLGGGWNYYIKGKRK